MNSTLCLEAFTKQLIESRYNAIKEIQTNFWQMVLILSFAKSQIITTRIMK